MTKSIDHLSIYTILAKSLKLTSQKTRRLVLLSTIAMSSLRILDVIGLGLILPIVGLLGNSEVKVENFVGSYIGSFFSKYSNSEISLILSGVLVCLIIIKSILSLASTYWFSRFFFNDQARFASRMFRAYLMAPQGYHDHKNAAELLRNLTTGISGWYSITIRNFSGLIADVFLAVSIIGIIIYANPMAALLGTSVLFVGVIIFWFGAARPVRKIAKESYKLQKELNKIPLESLSAVKDIKILGRHNFFITSFTKHALRLSRAGYVFQVFNQLPQHIFEIIGVMSIFIFIGVSHFQGNQQETVAFIALFGAAMLRLMPVVQRLMGTLNQLRTIEPALKDIVSDITLFGNWIYTAEEIPLPAESFSSSQFLNKIELNGINFGYDKTKLIIKNITTSIGKGNSLGIVGPSGAGKSTIAELLLGLVAPISGEIRFDGEIRKIEEPAINRSVGYVPQYIVLLDDSIRNNVAFGINNEDIDENLLKIAIQKSQLTDFLDTINGGLDAIVGERGIRISGGQRQRIAIARALYNDPQILILDEATSSLDVEKEVRITETLKNLAKEKTLIIIAHRLSTVQHCDNLIFLNDGKILAEGTFDELQKNCKEFRQWVKQAQLGSTQED